MSRKALHLSCAFLLGTCGSLAGCYSLETSHDAGNDLAPDVPGDVGVDCDRDAWEMLGCDAIYIPLVTFTFTDGSTGLAFCGPADISYLSECGSAGSYCGGCDCLDGTMVPTCDDAFPCHLSPPVGETSTITVTAEGYRDFVTEVTLPYECHPLRTVDVLLEPL
jgi:hypothetical protein